MEPVDAFAELIEAGDPPLDLAATLIAAAHRPGLDVVGVLADLDDVAAACPSPTFDALVRHLFQGPHAFRGNSVRYDDPDNSLLDQVLARRTGLPISLAVVAIEVGRRIGVELVGIGMPAHFLVRTADPPSDGGPAFCDPFHGGVRRSAADCEALFAEMTGGATSWDPRFLAPVSTRTILVRMLTNLKLHHLRAGRIGDLRTVMRLRAAFPELAVAERNEFARLMASTN
jgi:regulator of sirC expression with transglutaminase-like and TPR domain